MHRHRLDWNSNYSMMLRYPIHRQKTHLLMRQHCRQSILHHQL